VKSILVFPCIINLFYVSNQRDGDLSSLFIVLQNHSTCFGCPLHPPSRVHKTVVTATGTSHVYRSSSYLALAWLKWGSCPNYGYFLTGFTSTSPIEGLKKNPPLHFFPYKQQYVTQVSSHPYEHYYYRSKGWWALDSACLPLQTK